MIDARQTAAKLAAQINEIISARGSNYGAPEDNFANIANFWNAWLHARYKCLIALDPVDVGVMSSLIKVARLAQTPGHEDSALDGAIYMLLGYGCGVSDREPGMSDDGFPEPVKAEEQSVQVNGLHPTPELPKEMMDRLVAESTGPKVVCWHKEVSSDGLRIWYNITKVPEMGRFIVMKHGIVGGESDALVWSTQSRWDPVSHQTVKWRYATTKEIHPDGVPEHLRETEEMKPNSVFIPQVQTEVCMNSRVLPYSLPVWKDDWHNSSLIPERNRYIVTKSSTTDKEHSAWQWLYEKWSEDNHAALWRYATDEEVGKRSRF